MSVLNAIRPALLGNRVERSSRAVSSALGNTLGNTPLGNGQINHGQKTCINSVCISGVRLLNTIDSALDQRVCKPPNAIEIQNSNASSLRPNEFAIASN